MLRCLPLLHQPLKRGLVLWTRPMVRTKKLNPLDWDPDVVLNRKPDFDLKVKCLSGYSSGSLYDLG